MPSNQYGRTCCDKDRIRGKAPIRITNSVPYWLTCACIALYSARRNVWYLMRVSLVMGDRVRAFTFWKTFASFVQLHQVQHCISITL